MWSAPVVLELFREFRYSWFSSASTCFCTGPSLILAVLGGIFIGFIFGCLITAFLLSQQLRIFLFQLARFVLAFGGSGVVPAPQTDTRGRLREYRA